jgi:hypothetical protein
MTGGSACSLVRHHPLILLGYFSSWRCLTLTSRRDAWPTLAAEMLRVLVIEASSDYPSRRRCRVLGGLPIAALGDDWH